MKSGRRNLVGMEQRALMLLQAAGQSLSPSPIQKPCLDFQACTDGLIIGFLDIDKLIEHRPPLDILGFWKRPAIPQGTPVSSINKPS